MTVSIATIAGTAIVSLLLIGAPAAGEDLRPLQTHTTDLRGQVLTCHPLSKREVPAPQVEVALYHFDPATRQRRLVTRSITDSKGFYYLRNVNHGRYVLEADRSTNFSIDVRPLDRQRFQFQDVPRIRLRTC